MAALFPPVGLLIALYRPNNRIGWLCVLIGLSGSLAVFSPAYAIYALFSNPGVLPGGALMSWLNIWVWAPGWVGIALLISLFPTGQLRSRRCGSLSPRSCRSSPRAAFVPRARCCPEPDRFRHCSTCRREGR